MTLEEFNKLSDISKLAEIEEGACLDFVQLSDKYYLLYSLGDFFVELEFNNDEDESMIRAFTDTAPLSKYYNNVLLPKLDGLQS